jgi:hypothetical protein
MHCCDSLCKGATQGGVCQRTRSQAATHILPVKGVLYIAVPCQLVQPVCCDRTHLCKSVDSSC